MTIQRSLLSMLFVILVVLNGCGYMRNFTYIPLQDLPEDYRIEQAKEDHCVIFKNGDIDYG